MYIWRLMLYVVYVYIQYFYLPVKPGQQILGGSDQFDHGGQEFVGGLMGVFAVVGGVLSALRHGAAQVVVRRSHLPHQSLQVVRLHTIVLFKILNNCILKILVTL